MNAEPATGANQTGSRAHHTPLKEARAIMAPTVDRGYQRKARRPQPTLDEIRTWPATVDVADAAAALGVSRSLAYDLLARGELPVKTLKVSGRLKVITGSLIGTLSGEPGGSAA